MTIWGSIMVILCGMSLIPFLVDAPSDIAVLPLS
jgi:hypothetical protein